MSEQRWWVRDRQGHMICEAASRMDARRIMAAYDAVWGIPTEALEAGALAKALEALAETAIGCGCPASYHFGPFSVEVHEETKGTCCFCRGRSALRALGRLP